MRRTSFIGIVSLLGLAPLPLLAQKTALAQPPTPRSAFDEQADRDAIARIVPRPYRNMCDTPVGPKHVRCFGKYLTDETGKPQVTPFPFGGGNSNGFGPSDIQSAYKLPTTGGAGKTVAVVDLYHYPNAEQDLATYRTMYGLPPCTSASGCFKQVDSNGQTPSFGEDRQGCQGWSGEASLDLQMVSAACPACKILLVEVDSQSNDFSSAVAEAIKLGAAAVSNSYGGQDDQDDPNYSHPGVLITASTGDSGYGVSSPATYTGVVAVGGTSLSQSSSSRGWAETAWNGAGSGCSQVVSKPSWETDTACGSNRANADVSAVADPSTPVAVYCSDSTGQAGWTGVGGTSAASPIVAAAFTNLNVNPAPSFVWQNTGDFFDVTSGSNGQCSPSALCNAGPGWDGPTGWGTPNGALLAMPGSSGSGSGSSGGSSSGSTTGSGSSSGSSSGGSSSGAGSSGSSGSSPTGPTGSSSSGAGSSSGSSGGSSSGSPSGNGPSSGSSGAPPGGFSGSGSSSGSSSGGSGPTFDQDAGSGGDSGADNFDWGPSSASGCGCAVVDGTSRYGSLATGLGLVLALRLRRRRR